MVCQRVQNVIRLLGITQPIKWTDGTISLYNDFSWQDASNRTSGGNNTSFNHNLSLRISAAFVHL